MSKVYATGIEVPLEPDFYAQPIVQYEGAGMTALHFPLKEDGWGRVTFTELDSISVSRGEFSPYRTPRAQTDSYPWVSIVSPSSWLRKRHVYESKHYRHSYEWGRDVDEMLTDYSHYLFTFHDQFVEVLATGIWFESAKRRMDNQALTEDHPLRGLAHHEPVEHFEQDGITYRVHRNPLPMEQIQQRAKLCSQPMLEIHHATLTRTSRPTWSLHYRERRGEGIFTLMNFLWVPICRYDARPDLETVRRDIAADRKMSS